VFLAAPANRWHNRRAVANQAFAMDWRVRERRAQRRKSGWQTSGGVVVDVDSGRVLIVRTRREARGGKSGWTWPKGLIDPGEGPIYAAIREIVEEAGVLAEPVAHIGVLETKHAFRHYFLLTKIKEGLPTGAETLAIKWVELGRAKELLDRKRDRKVLRFAMELLAKLDGAKLQGRNFAMKPSRAPVLTSGPLPRSPLPKSTAPSK
jgi:8-oxo-dGTP pyrophosphatase MutT (NUDIX family)